MNPLSPNAVPPPLIGELLSRQPDFLAFVRRRVPDDAIAADLLQQSFVRAVQGAHNVRDLDHSVAWFYRILRNAVTDYYRAQAVEQKKTEGLMQDLQALEADKTPALDELRATVCTCLERLLPSLRPAYADLIKRIDLEGIEAAVVAKELGVTPNNLTVRLHRARQALRKSLEESCGVCTKHGCLHCTCEAPRHAN